LSQGGKKVTFCTGKEPSIKQFSDYLHLHYQKQQTKKNVSNSLVKQSRRQRVCAMVLSYSHIILSDHAITMPKIADFKIPKNSRGGGRGGTDGQPGHGVRGAPRRGSGRGATRGGATGRGGATIRGSGRGARGGGGQATVGSTEWAKKRSHAKGSNAENPHFKLGEPGNPSKNFRMNLSTWRLVIPATMKAICGALWNMEKTGKNKIAMILNK
jgi:hypothetical protein